ncbi:hypothetical protein P7K49_012775 [Saguinus oedipus]|uniref:Uncharacterized protein n=1 Tax=Saguinus oedipus TaxID=9490 RepID=A0ABQ9VEX2_SAGOE|nr:hypothetical protein P7K49_012775 [Saguinus oedipus]
MGEGVTPDCRLDLDISRPTARTSGILQRHIYLILVYWTCHFGHATSSASSPRSSQGKLPSCVKLVQCLSYVNAKDGHSPSAGIGLALELVSQTLSWGLDLGQTVLSSSISRWHPAEAMTATAEKTVAVSQLHGFPDCPLAFLQ